MPHEDTSDPAIPDTTYVSFLKSRAGRVIAQSGPHIYEIQPARHQDQSLHIHIKDLERLPPLRGWLFFHFQRLSDAVILFYRRTSFLMWFWEMAKTVVAILF